MPFEDVADDIRAENSNQPSVEDQVTIARWFCNNEIAVPRDNHKRTSEIKDAVSHRLDHEVRGILDNLEQIGVVEQDPRGGRTFIRHERCNEYFHAPEGNEFLDLLAEEMSRFFDDLAGVPAASDVDEATVSDHDDADAAADGGRNIRTVAAEALDVAPTLVEEYVETPDDPADQMVRFDTGVEAIKENEDVERGGDYDQMGWRNSALRWALSEHSYRTARNSSLEDFQD